MSKRVTDVVQYIKDNIDIVQIIGKYVNLEMKGGKYWGLSPFKAEKTPSFTVDPDKKYYYCFSTSQGGDIFDFIKKVEGVDFKGAIRLLARDLGIDVDNSSFHNLRKDEKKERVQELCNRIGKTFTYLLHQEIGVHALQYMKKRGFSDEVLSRFQIGYAPKDKFWLYNFLHDKKYKESEMNASGLFSKNYKNYALFTDRIMFPIFTISGQIVGYGGRQISGDDGPKYINSPETELYKKKKLLYGLYQCMELRGFAKHKKAYLVEGYLDVLALHMANYHSAVAPLGTAFTKEQAELLLRGTKSIVMVFDNDDAGLQASIKSAIYCEQVGFESVKIVVLSENDPADIIQKHGSVELGEQLLEEQDFFDYYLNEMLQQTGESLQEKERSIMKILEYVSVVQSEYRRAEYVSRIADMFNTTGNIVMRMLEKIKVPQNHYTTEVTVKNSSDTKTTQQKQMPIIKNGELLTLVALGVLSINDKKNFEKFRANIKYKDIDDIHARKIYATLELLHRQNNINYHTLFENLDSRLAAFMQEMIASGEATDNATEILDDYLIQIKLKRLKKRSKEIEHELRICGNESNTKITHIGKQDGEVMVDDTRKIIQELLEEKQFINNEIIRLNESR